MAYLTIQDFKSRTLAQPGDVDGLSRLRWTRNSGDTSAAQVSKELRFAEVVVPGTVQYMLLTASQAVAHDAANYATITVYKRTQGGARVTVGALQTSATDLPAGVPVAIPVVAGSVASEDVLTVEITKAGTGVVVPTLILDVRPDVSFLDKARDAVESYIDARLRKRYAVPFAAPVPEIVLQWATALLTELLFSRRGLNPASEQDKALILEAATRARTELKEAADAVDGLFDLPLTQGVTPDVSAIAKNQPFGYSEASPYVAYDDQLDRGAREDSWGHGT